MFGISQWESLGRIWGGMFTSGRTLRVARKVPDFCEKGQGVLPGNCFEAAGISNGVFSKFTHKFSTVF